MEAPWADLLFEHLNFLDQPLPFPPPPDIAVLSEEVPRAVNDPILIGLWREIEDLVPPAERSAVIHQALARELKKRRRQAGKRISLPAVSVAVEEDTWRLAAAAAKEYYKADPEAVEWAMFAGDTL